MQFVNEFRDGELVGSVLSQIRRSVTQPWVLMEICGGQTHSIMRYGLDQLLPPEIELVHGPGDVLQFRNYHVVVVQYTQVVRNTMGGQLPSEPEQTTLSDYARPHHTALVSKVNGQGNLEVAEQNAPVNNQGDKVNRVVFNTIDLWPAVTYLPSETSQDGLATIITYRWKVRFVRYDNLWGYHPKPRPPKTASAGDTFGTWGGGTTTGDGTGGETGDTEDTFGSWG